jgi:cytoskeletal protein CcmA (bactofilin family)
MAFRRDEPSDDFRRQVSALRNQLGQAEGGEPKGDATPAPTPAAAPESASVPATPAITRAAARPARPAAPAASAQAGNGDTGVISAGMHITGSISSNGPVHIFGSIDGDVSSDTDVLIAEGADAQATITAPRVTVAGEVTGRITCTELLEVLPRGSVSGDVETSVIIVHDGARLNGNLSMRGGQMTAATADETESADEDGE